MGRRSSRRRRGSSWTALARPASSDGSSWSAPVFGVLAGMKWLRGTPLDPFGFAAVRRLERQLPGEYRVVVEKALVGLSPESYERAVKLAGLPDLIRGYEEIKLRNVQRFR